MYRKSVFIIHVKDRDWASSFRCDGVEAAENLLNSPAQWMSTVLKSSQDFIRALKSSSDPPHPDGPLKIQIAGQAWDNSSLYIPNKGQVIADWLLTRLLKERSNEGERDPVSDVEHWLLLARIIDPVQDGDSRRVKVWLAPLLNRIPITPILVTFLHVLPSLSRGQRVPLLVAFSCCIKVLWPLAIQKVSPDILLDCFGVLLGLFGAEPDPLDTEQEECLLIISPMIISAYRSALFNSTNKKKLYTSFTTNHLQTWLQCICPTLNTDNHPSYASDAYTAGVETLFCIDVLRQLTESGGDNNLFDTLTKISPSLIFSVLPRLFLSFCSSVRKFRGTLFGQKHESGSASSLDHVRTTGMKFYALCDSFLRSKENMWKDVWKTRTALLEIVERENLYSAAHEEHDRLLKETCASAVTELQRVEYDTCHSEVLAQTLCVLATIDYDIVAISIPSIFRALVNISGAAPSSSALLKLILDFQTKTRTVPTHLLDLLEALTPGRFSVVNPREIYQIVLTSPIFDPAHIDQLRMAINRFVTPGQCLELIQNTAEIVQRVWEEFQETHQQSNSDTGERAGKKRKLDHADVAGKDPLDMSSETTAISFAFLCRLISVIWTSIPVNTVQDDVKTRMRDSVQGFRTAVILPALKGFKNISKENKRKGLDAWSWEVAVTAVMKLQYSLTSSKLGIEVFQEEKLKSRMVKVLESDESLPELKLEIARFFLSQASLNGIPDFASIFDSLLDQIEVLPQIRLVQWDGRSSTLVRSQNGKEQAAVALLHVLVDRWLPVMEEMANTQQLERFIKTLFHATISRLPGSLLADGLSPYLIYRKTLRSADFWELPNLRNVFLSYVNDETLGLEQVDLHKILDALHHSSPVTLAPVIDIQKVMAPYETLLFVPPEYISKNVRTALLRRGLTADVILTTLSSANREDGQLFQMRIRLREFLCKVFLYTNSIEHNAVHEMLNYLMDSRWIPKTPAGAELIDVTLQLIEMHLSALVRLGEKGQDEALLKSIKHSMELDAFENGGGYFDRAVIIRFLNVITKSATAVRISREVSASLQNLAISLTDQLERRLVDITCESSNFINDLRTNVLLVEAWCQTLALRRWLQINDGTPHFGPAIVHKILSLGEASTLELKSIIELCKSAISVLLAELQVCPSADRAGRLKVIIVTYVPLYRFCEKSDISKLDSTIAPICDFLSVEDFSSVLDFSLELLSDKNALSHELGPLICLQRALLHQAPEGTMKISQRHVTGCLDLFLDRSTFWEGQTRLKFMILNFISSICGNRPASVRSGDVHCIWTILSKHLVGSEKHDEATSKNVFHELVATLSALIRLRRDLVLPTLPHLGMILRQLTMTMRSVRPQLGGKQRKMVADTFPSWINPSQPLGVDDAKALARLFATITTKTVVRVYGASSDLQKAESLARPFGKHASYVLVAYIEAMNDPLCVISAEVRKELYPGLFALCGMLSDNDREALMLSALDGGGKMTMKTLWKEYEKQKYIGKG